ncbi:MAG TPA: molybdopterin-dependent oxidoreductase, partial [Pyrinomonadaceae bacterium]|nr:molybdopterin-dependent oxidoreductase [Pyrinomonadaceae bacterium]
TISTCTYCSDGCQMSLGSRGGELMRIVARDRYVDGLNGEFLCIKGRFGHPFVNHEKRIRTPLIRHQKGGKLIPSTWDEAIRFAAEKLKAINETNGNNSTAVVASPRLTNEAIYSLWKFAAEVLSTQNYAVADAFSLGSFFENLGGALASHRDIRYAKTIVLIGGEPEELQPLTGKQIRQAVRNGGAKLVIINSVPIRLREQASQFVHITPGAEDAAVLALADSNNTPATKKLGVEASDFDTVRKTIGETQGDLVFMFGGDLSAEARACIAQFPYLFAADDRRVLLHPLPLFNNSVGAHDMMNGAKTLNELLSDSGDGLRALYLAGSLLPEQIRAHEETLAKLDFVIVQELFETETTSYADVVFPAASFAEIDGTFTNNDGFVQRVRKSIEPVHQSKPDWMITGQLAKALGVEFGFEMSASAVFREIAARISGYADLRYPSLKDESQPVRVKHAITARRDLSGILETIRRRVEGMDERVPKIQETPPVGHELFKLGTLTDKVPQFHLLANGNPIPETFAISPLYQITIDEGLKREPAIA